MAGSSEGHWFLANSGGAGRIDLGEVDHREQGGSDFPGYVFSLSRDVPAGGINDAGQVIINLANCASDRPCIYSAGITGPDGSGVANIDNEATVIYGTELHGINNAGDAVGIIDYAHMEDPNAGFIQAHLSAFRNLTWDFRSKGVALTDAVAINNAGQILAIGSGANLIPPVPEPKMYATLIAGLALVSLVIRQSRGEFLVKYSH
jgi:hypothetical protein